MIREKDVEIAEAGVAYTQLLETCTCNEFREDFESYGTEINRDIWSTWDEITDPIELGYDPKGEYGRIVV